MLGWRRALGLMTPLLALVLCACSTLSGTAVDAVRAAVAGQPQVQPTAASVAARPYSQLQVESSKTSALLILGNVDAGREAWYSAAHEIVFLRHGLMVKTSGLAQDIDATRLPADSPFRTGLQRLRAPVETTRSLDLSPGYRYGVTAASTLTPIGPEAVDILGTTHRLLRIDEQVRIPALDFQATNRYWVDPEDGFVWKSRQTIPGGPTLTLTVLRPYRSPTP